MSNSILAVRRQRHICQLLLLLVAAALSGCAGRSGPVRVQPASAVSPEPARPGAVAPAPSAADQSHQSELEKKAFEAMRRGDIETGIDFYEQVIARESGNGRARYHLGYGYGQMGDLEKEILYYNKAIELGYRTDEVYRNLGNAYRLSDQLLEALAVFQQALESSPQDADNHMQIGLAYEDLGRDDRAEAGYVRAIELAPDETAFREYLASFYEERGRFSDAALQYEQILEIDPGNEGARMNLEHITRRLQRPSSEGTGVGGN